MKKEAERMFPNVTPAAHPIEAAPTARKRGRPSKRVTADAAIQ